MPMPSLEKISSLQKIPANIRNICILAHVDHGKTTLADALVASNGIISQRMAGKLRYMDSREDEQVRGITMKSSAISLYYEKAGSDYLINLIDSPGHVDFSSEVSTAVRLCDGAVVVVDVVEGVCPQTHAVLQQAWLENIKPVLVLNKLDRLIIELKMEPMEAYLHLQQILEQVNVVTSEFFTSDAMEKTSNQTDEIANGDSSAEAVSHDWTSSLEDTEDRNIYFSPDQGNVIFASAYDGWGFTINHFADLYSSKLGLNKEVLQKTLWGDFYLNSKTKRIMKGAQLKAKKPLFVQFVLENIWSVYDSIYIRRDKEMMEKIVKSLGLSISARDARHNDYRVKLQAVTSQWIPVSEAVLDVVVQLLPSPLDMCEEKVEKLMCSQARRFDTLPKETQELKTVFMGCTSSDDVPVIVFVSKMFPVEKKILPQNRQRPLTDEEIQQRREKARLRHAEKMAGQSSMGESVGVTVEASCSTDNTTDTVDMNGVVALDVENVQDSDKESEEDYAFIAFARVFSGSIKKGQKLYVLGPKHDPSKCRNLNSSKMVPDESKTLADLDHDEHITTFTVNDLYLFMGRELENMEEIPAGNILGIGGLEDHILNSATVSSTLACPAFTDLYFDASPIVRVALETAHTGDMHSLVHGLKLLNQADPCVEVLVQETGEHVIIAAGEVHLQRCIDDLKERYAKVDINVSDPIVPFRETIITRPKTDMVNEAIMNQNLPTKSMQLKKFEDDDEVIEAGLVEMYTPNKKCCIRIRAVPLPEKITNILDENHLNIKILDQSTNEVIGDNSVSGVIEINVNTMKSLKELKDKLDQAFKEAGKHWRNAVNEIWAFGPRRVGPNILLNRVDSYKHPNIWTCIEKDSICNYCVRDFDNSIVSGFEIATLAGPLCEEPMRGVCYIIEKWDYLDQNDLLKTHCDKNNEDFSHKLHMQNVIENEHKSVELIMEKLHIDKTNRCESHGLEVEEKQRQEVVVTSAEERQRLDSCKSEDDFEVDRDFANKKQEVYGPFSGQLISCVKDGCRKAFQTQQQRLMAAMYKCDIQATAEVLGKLYAVIGKRNGRIQEGDMREGTQVFNIIAYVPVIESFGFAEDIRKKTSGLARPQLVFSHWEVVDVDPFWVPTTEEEYLHFGEKADCANRALDYMNTVRTRKGLKVDKKIVEHAEKQRTLTRNK